MDAAQHQNNPRQLLQLGIQVQRFTFLIEKQPAQPPLGVLGMATIEADPADRGWGLDTPYIGREYRPWAMRS